MLVKGMKSFLVVMVTGSIISCKQMDRSVRLGEYQGAKDGIVEVIILKKDGIFEHNAFRGSEKLLSEAGAYSVKQDEVRLMKFSQIYNPMTNAMNQKGELFEFCDFTYINYESFSELKADVGQDYSLILSAKVYSKP